MNRLLLAVGVGVSLASSAGAQTIPEGSQAMKVQPAYRRTPSYRIDPFRHVSIPHWGFVFSLGASAANNTLNVRDGFAITIAYGVLFPGAAFDNTMLDARPAQVLRARVGFVF